MAKAQNPIPDGYHTVTPSLTFDNGAAQAIEWYKKALGAQETARVTGPDGKVVHAEIRIGNSPIMLMDAMMGAKGARTLGGSPASLWVYVEDCDALFNRAVGAGGKVVPHGEMTDQFWGDRSGSFADPYGYTWSIATHKEDLSPEERKKRQDEFMSQLAGKA
jgi:uncharacterized glyoxalase superfamily protein PhnB